MIGATVQTVAGIECPRCHGRHHKIQGEQAICCTCSHVFNWRNPSPVFRGKA